MWFITSKLFWVVFAPVNLLLGLLIFALALMVWRRKSRAARALAGILVPVALALAILPIGHLLMLPLENRFPPPAHPPDRVDGIIVLGGAVRPDMTARRDQVSLNRAAERMTAAVTLSRRYPDAKLVFTGANAALFPTGNTESAVARRFFAEMGLDAGVIVYEERSRNTYENALFTRDLVMPRAGETWLLVTSARHMPRSIGCFRKVGWQVIPWPVDYETTPGFPAEINLDMLANLEELTDAVHEWAGMLAYWLIGYSASPYPGP